MIIVTGGSGSGKSKYAEDLAVKINKGKLYYIAAMEPFGSEARERIRRHRQMRAEKGFETIEKYRNINEISVEKNSTVLLECMSNLTANEMFGGERLNFITEDILRLNNSVDNLIVVTNNVFADIPVKDNSLKKYISCLAKINNKLTENADKVVEIYYGIEIILKE